MIDRTDAFRREAAARTSPATSRAASPPATPQAPGTPQLGSGVFRSVVSGRSTPPTTSSQVRSVGATSSGGGSGALAGVEQGEEERRWRWSVRRSSRGSAEGTTPPEPVPRGSPRAAARRSSGGGGPAMSASLLASQQVSLQGSPQMPRQQRARQLQAFLEELQGISIGPLSELEGRLIEAKALHAHALRVTSAQAEREALTRVESCAKLASMAASLANRRLQKLAGEVNDASAGTTEANLRRQSFTGECARYQSLVHRLFQAQQAFKLEMEAKVRRNFRSSEHDTDVVAAALAANSPSSTAQGFGSGSAAGGNTRTTATALEAMEVNNEELALLARAADELRQAFLDVESLVSVQGERLDDIEAALSRTQFRTHGAQEQLVLATEARRKCQYWWCVLATTMVGLIVVLLFFIFDRH